MAEGRAATMSHFFDSPLSAGNTEGMISGQDQDFLGKHYETGTISNWLATEGLHLNEATVLGASGGIAFGYFVFEYTGHLPHVALLTRNTFSPFERALDNLGIRRDTMETVKPEKGLENLKRELDLGHSVVVWADMFSASWNCLNAAQMWAMLPMLVVGYEDDGFWVVDQSQRAILVSTDELQAMRGRVKKDRFKIMVLQGIDENRLKPGLIEGIKTCTALYLDKPPAGSANNFGIAGMEHFVKMVRDDKTALGWGKKFPPGDKFKQAIAGKIGQPGIWDWIERWGSNSGADRGTYAEFLRDASSVIGKDFSNVAAQFDESAKHWRELAEASLRDSIPVLAEMKKIKLEMAQLRMTDPAGSIEKRTQLKQQYAETWEHADDLESNSKQIRESIASKMEEISPLEKSAITELRNLVG